MNKSSEMGLSKLQLCRSKQCPSCGHNLQSKPDWLGLPAGVKFDPTDQELIEHLQAKLQHSNSSHPFIDDFITTVEGEDGICYTHPQNLPGVRRDGLSRHFFHRPSKAYTTGTRKRRKIQTECDGDGSETRWHKTGKTRAVMVSGTQIGCKKILVLYTNSVKKGKPGKTNWVMHQYHLGQHEEEREGQLVVSKIFYQTQPRQSTLPAARLQNSPLLHGGGVDEFCQLKADRCNLDLPFRRTTIDDEGGNIEETSTAREADGTCPVADVAHHHVAYYPNQIHISSLISPLNHTPPDQDFQEQQHHHKLGASSGLEELIMSCTSTNTKQETSIANPQEAE